jgi:hypothetical protein
MRYLIGWFEAAMASFLPLECWNRRSMVCCGWRVLPRRTIRDWMRSSLLDEEAAYWPPPSRQDAGAPSVQEKRPPPERGGAGPVDVKGQCQVWGSFYGPCGSASGDGAARVDGSAAGDSTADHAPEIGRSAEAV